MVKAKNPQALFHTVIRRLWQNPLNVQNLNVELSHNQQLQNSGTTRHGSIIFARRHKYGTYFGRANWNPETWPGVENTPLIVGFTKASELAFKDFEANTAKMRMLRDKLVDGIFAELDDLRFNGPKGDKRSSDNANVSILRAEGEALTIELSLQGVYVSSGSACSRRLLQPSHVLIAIGRIFEEAHGSILMKTTRYLTEEDIAYVLKVLPTAVNRIRGIVGSTGVH